MLARFRLAVAGLFAATAVPAFAQSTVFSDTFERLTLNGGPTTYATGGVGSQVIAAVPHQLNNLPTSVLRLASSVPTVASSGTSFVTASTNFGGGYQQQLNQNAVVQWTFNFRQGLPNAGGQTPGGFDAGEFGLAIVLGASGSDLTTANGYAVTLGRQGNSDRVGLVRFNGGIASDNNHTNVLGNNDTIRLNSIGGDNQSYASVRITYTAATNNWSLAVRNDGATSWTNPAGGTYTAGGPNSDIKSGAEQGTTLTNTSLANFGFFWNYGSSLLDPNAVFDNYSVGVTPVPEPTFVLAGVAVVGIGLTTRRRQ
jgi:hypothetical protein